MTEEEIRQADSVVSEGEEKEKIPDKEIDLNVLFPNETNDLNSLFPDEETRELLKKVKKNKKDMESMIQTFDDDSEPTETKSQE